jgi:zinc D-Ala-D-Ala dipeptidase
MSRVPLLRSRPESASVLSPTSRLSIPCLTVACACLGWMLASSPQAAQQRALPAPLVYLRDVDATILQDMRYATVDNFTGRRVTGYDAPECVLLDSVAQALARVQKDLASSGLSLKVYDCYRPERAVRAFVAWVRDGRSDKATRRFHPRLAKPQLLAQGYIAQRSGHSRGSAVDLTLVRLPAAEVEPFDPARAYGACTQPQSERASDSSLDMGTGFDCFDAMSHTGASGLSPEQRQARQTLGLAMARHGFINYPREWWHFSLATTEGGGRSFDVPIRARPQR